MIPTKENNRPPIVPAANGNQNDSFVEPIMNGIKPRTVDIIVSIIGRSMDVAISRIKKSLKAFPEIEITSVYGSGYRLTIIR